VTNRPPSYQVFVEPAAERKLARLPRDICARLLRRIESLAETPRAPGAVKLTGHSSYRVGVGDYRIIYAILDDRLLIIVVDVGHRREIYRDL